MTESLEDRAQLLPTDQNAAPRVAASWEPPVEVVKSPRWLLGSVLVGAGGVSLLFHAVDVDLRFDNDVLDFMWGILLLLPGLTVVSLGVMGVRLWRKAAIPKGSRTDIELSRIGAAATWIETAWGFAVTLLFSVLVTLAGAVLLFDGIRSAQLEHSIYGTGCLILGLGVAVQWRRGVGS